MNDQLTINKYISQFSKEEQIKLQQIRTLIIQTCNDAEERISKGIPAYFYLDNSLIRFSLYNKQIKFYLSKNCLISFQQRLQKYKCTKTIIYLSLDKKIPNKLLRDIISFCMKENKQIALNKEKAKWTITKVLEELKKAGSEQTKKTYLRHGAQEPLFGVTTRDMKPIMKKTGKNHELAMELFATGNYDAMYFAGMIAEPNKMVKEDFYTWIKKAYCQGIADYTVAVTLAETSFAKEIADQWIKSTQELYASAGWSCYSWLLGSREDTFFEVPKIKEMLDFVKTNIHLQPDSIKYAMNSFIIAVGISYIPLHEYAYEIAKMIGTVDIDPGDTSCKTPDAIKYIEKAKLSNRIGFKRKNVRC